MIRFICNYWENQVEKRCIVTMESAAELRRLLDSCSSHLGVSPEAVTSIKFCGEIYGDDNPLLFRPAPWELDENDQT